MGTLSKILGWLASAALIAGRVIPVTGTHGLPAILTAVGAILRRRYSHGIKLGRNQLRPAGCHRPMRHLCTQNPRKYPARPSLLGAGGVLLRPL